MLRKTIQASLSAMPSVAPSPSSSTAAPSAHLPLRRQQRSAGFGRTPVLRFKTKVDTHLPAFKESASFGALFTVKDMPPKLSKGKPYSVFEIRSELSPHLLRSAAESCKDWGALPGLFTRDQATGRPQNLTFETASQDHTKLQGLWVMVFVEEAKTDMFRESLRGILLRAASIHKAELGTTEAQKGLTSIAALKLHFVQEMHNCVFEEDGPEETGIIYEVNCEFTDLLYTTQAMLERKGHHVAIVTTDPDNNPIPPKMMISIPAKDEQGLKDFPAVLRSASNSGLKKYKEALNNLIDEHLKVTGNEEEGREE